MSETIRKLEDIPGVGPATAQKLQAAGYNTLESVAVASSRELADSIGLSTDKAAEISMPAREILQIRCQQKGGSPPTQSYTMGICFYDDTVEDLGSGAFNINVTVGLGEEAEYIVEFVKGVVLVKKDGLLVAKYEVAGDPVYSKLYFYAYEYANQDLGHYYDLMHAKIETMDKADRETINLSDILPVFQIAQC